MQQTIDSIQQVGILTPVILRPDDSGGFEMISGHRRLYAAGLAGLDTIPAIVRNMTDDEAIIFMVDSNLQRETILPSERAKAYKMKLDAIKRQAGRPSKKFLSKLDRISMVRLQGATVESSPDSHLKSGDIYALNELDPALLKMVDDGKIGLTPAVELSFLNPQEQTMLLDTIDSEQATPSLSQAQRMKKLSGEGKLNDDTMLSIMMEQKKPENWNLTLPMDRIRKFFPRSFTPQQMENTILKLLEAWQKKRQRQNEH
jgi:ParB family chromosome partitioning protein